MTGVAAAAEGARARAGAGAGVGVGEALVPYAVAARSLLRDTVMDAAGALLLARPWREISMAQIAAAAGVSRQTLYNEFGSRDELALAFVLREEELLVEAVSGVLAEHRGDVVRALGAAFETFLELAEARPVARHVLTGDDDGLIALVTTRGRPVVGAAAARLEEIVLAQWPAIAPADAELLADMLVRLAISYAALPAVERGAPAAAAQLVVRALGPFALKAAGS